MKTYTLTGMTCAGCAAKVLRTLKILSEDVLVTLEPPRAVVPDNVSLSTVKAALQSVGNYSAREVTADETVDAQNILLSWFQTYYPLLLIMGLVTLVSFAGDSWMMSFMAGFYLVFGAFKLLDVPAFARSYAAYDPIAKVFPAWGYAYPFVEIALGFAFLFWFQMLAATWLALLLSLIGAYGALVAVLRKQQIQCACLGTGFNLPMSTVTIIENVMMALMALWMLTVGM